MNMKPGRLQDEVRVHRGADHVLLGPALAGELRVLLLHQQTEMRAEQSEDDQRHDRTWRMNIRGMIEPLPGKFPPKRKWAR